MPASVLYVAAGLLLIGAAPLPYGYYTLLRWLACLTFSACCVVAVQKRAKLLPWAYGFGAIIFNPLVKVHLPRDAWIAVDIAAGVLLMLTARHVR